MNKNEEIQFKEHIQKLKNVKLYLEENSEGKPLNIVEDLGYMIMALEQCVE